MRKSLLKRNHKWTFSTLLDNEGKLEITFGSQFKQFRKKVCIQCSDPYLKNILKIADGPVQEKVIKVINRQKLGQ